MEFTTPRLVGAVCGLMLGIVAVQALFPAAEPPAPPPAEPLVNCVGEPIAVDYDYTGWSAPHACAPQCEDNNPRYILYKNGEATQCETPPGCNDWGEDKNVLCLPVLNSI